MSVKIGLMGIKVFSFKAGIHEDVERVRRAHLNDMENVIPFLFLGFMYMFTNPAYSTALWLYR